MGNPVLFIRDNQGNKVPVTALVGPHFTPSVSAGGDLSWTNNGNLPNPQTVNLRDVYFCIYGTTTYEDIAAARTNGKIPMLFYDGKAFLLTKTMTGSGAYHLFTAPTDTGCCYIKCNAASGAANWTEASEVTFLQSVPNTYRTAAAQDVIDDGKQDVIADLSSIRTGAGLGATAYQKPSGGIPASDLASAVQTSLGKADTAYQKDANGIPATDLTSAVQTSLGKADTALQSGAYVDDCRVEFRLDEDDPSSDVTERLSSIAKKAYTALQPDDGLDDCSVVIGEGPTPLGTFLNSLNTAISVLQTGKANASDLAAKQDKLRIETSIEYGELLTKNTQYYLGQRSTVSFELPATYDAESGETVLSAGDLITCVFYSGATAATLSVTGTFVGELIVPKANERIELNMLYDGVNWAIVSNAMAVPAEVSE